MKVVLWVLLLFSPLTLLAESPDMAQQQQAKELIQRFAGELKHELMTAMQQDGPVEAIAVCQQIAPELATQLSAESTMQIRRTSLQLRNPGNQPDAWEQKVLQRFEQQQADGEAIAHLEFSEVVDENGAATFRMMKAIGIEPACLTCHGSQLSDQITQQLKRLYPEDQATGYQVGDVRGAFSVRQALIK